jgi:predicted ATP-dependent endonuclease of OLD family
LAKIPKTEKLFRLYIPALRGLRPFGDIGDCYSQRTQSDYFNTTPVPTIFTGLTLRNEIEELQLGDYSARKSVERFQKFLGKEFFNGQEVALLSRKGKDVLYVKIGQEVELPIYDLGDGIQTIIITTFPLFKNEHRAALVCIEEPELYLHPGFQRVLLKTLASFSRNIYFIATHSNHLLDLTLDFEGVSIFTFHKTLEQSDQPEAQAKFAVERVSSHDHRALQLLGTRNSSVFLSNCTVWVEGITDRRYFSHFLDLYQKALSAESGDLSNKQFIAEEDLHYSFVEYAGSNITHWSFLDEIVDPIEVERLCGRLFLVTDKDDASNPAKRERHEKLAAKLDNRYYLLGCREVENLLSPAILETVVRSYEGTEAPFNSVTHDDYKDEPLGNFIEHKLLTAKQRKGSYATESGSVTDKLTFCERAINVLTDFKQLSDEAQNLTRRIYEFIKQENGH